MTWAQRSAGPPRPPGPAPAAAPPIASSHICCGQRLRRLAVEPPESQLSFTFCARCEALRWFRADVPIDEAPADAQRLASRHATGDQPIAKP